VILLAPSVKDVLDYQLFHIGPTPVTTGSLVAAILLIVASYVVARLSRSFVADRLLAHTRLSIGVRYMLGRFTAYAIFFFGLLAGLQTLGINANTLTAFGAALGVGIGFGLQDIVKNFVAGIVILIERPFEVGDRVELDNVSAEVAEIRPRATILRTNDDVHLIVPNSRFMRDTIVNRSYDKSLYRTRAPVTVDNSSDPNTVAEALLEAARVTDGALKDPPPTVQFRLFGQRGLDFELLCWTDKLVHRPGALVSRLNFAIREEFRRRGIRLPQNEVQIRRIEEAPPPASAEDPGS
jgi:small-conductance mechanosensitive channel